MKTNTAPKRRPVRTHEGGRAVRTHPFEELRRAVLSCMLFENTFYEKGNDIAARIAALVSKCHPHDVTDLAIKARTDMQLRHAPLFLLRENLRERGDITAAARLLTGMALPQVIQRADELAEFLALYWRDGRQPLAAQVKKGLEQALKKFDAYQLAKYNRKGAVTLRDVLRLIHPRPDTREQSVLWGKIIEGTLEPPDTWEVALSGGANKKATFERLLREGKLGGLAVLRNLRNMEQARVDDELIRERLRAGAKRALPYRFIAAARHAPRFEVELEAGMMKAVNTLPLLRGMTGLLIDVSGSMDDKLSSKSTMTRLDAACGLAIHLTEACSRIEVATFSNKYRRVPPRRGFALRDAIVNSQRHEGTYLAAAVERALITDQWALLDRVIIITDEQSHDGGPPSWVGGSGSGYIINVAPYKYGVASGNGWTTINGWSERIVDYIDAIEGESRVDD